MVRFLRFWGAQDGLGTAGNPANFRIMSYISTFVAKCFGGPSPKNTLQKAKEIMEANGFDHNNSFQNPRYSAKKPPPAEHWKEFRTNLAHSIMGKCSICNEMLRGLWTAV